MASVQRINNFINGKYASTENYLESLNPCTEEIIAHIADSTTDDAKLAVQAARQAFPSWSRQTAAKRIHYLNRIADLIEARLEDFARAESSDQGKPLWLARTVEIPRAVDNFRFFATALSQSRESFTQHTSAPNVISYTTRSPCGVAVLISPWNLPLYLLTWKIAPCIAFGCTCVCKPSEFTSVTAGMLAQVFIDAELPPGVVNLVFGVGPRVGQALITHPDVNAISFTGSTVTGYHIKKAISHLPVKISLEMGGKNAGIIFNDADLSKCLPVLLRSCFLNSGQICLCTSRLYVQREIYDEFLKKFIAEVNTLKVGDPSDDSTKMGPVVSKEHQHKIEKYIEIARQNGNEVIVAGIMDENIKKSDKGYFIMPTVILNVDDESKLMTEEIFGPVVCIVPFDTEDEVMERVNKIQYGLCGCIWTESLGRAHRLATRMECGTVWINGWMLRDLRMPFGGVKDSGMGREGYPYSEDVFTEIKTVGINIA
ncbi:unnamed protein product [Rotaria magnacalcarata]|uniref:Aldehyde dehydrogenase domain-containing protein n=2 Tax=Rotaria magnacalcarata TaxID=392030 RepID=A0A816TU89_9BILA|nr:unnamed protein product [Rotaria magnacalcarata]CAF2100932.1 unnamed protein product [Rotaria magnacalcarata]CAF2146736.1 unnamed protein product [Rotaria magnacalcarata]CAF4041200.1 unnamed protein product [Rotaria magnacalcarata]CAF4094915.1 unnamed protein product [Rotaria magnacalcarata]